MSEQDLLKFLLELETGRKVIKEMQGASGSVYIIDQGENAIPRNVAYKSIRIDKITDKKRKSLLKSANFG